MRDLLSHPIVGMSYEGFVIENLITALAGTGQVSFYRTVVGAEIDLVIERGQDIIAIEIKRTLSPKLTPGFLNGCQDIKATQRYFVYPGDKRFSLGQSTEAIPLPTLMDILASHN
jgi:predicted AAA+ superfamily ATPase